MDRELLLEIGVEELPAAWLPGLNRQLQEKLRERLKEMRLTPDAAIETFTTPRRLTARIGSMPERQEDLDETVTGPPVSAGFNAAGEPTPAALGFARKQGIAFEALERVKTEKGEYLAARKHVRGKSTVDALPDLLGGLLRDLSFPKQMHWDAMLEDGRGELVFGRPIRWLLYLYGGRVVPFTIARTPGAAGASVQEVTSAAVTYGHRFLATSGRAGRSVKVRTFDDYRARLPEHFVILEHSERRDRIGREIESKARKLGGRVPLREHAALLDEVADLVEYPGVVAGFFDRAFLDLPHEVLTTTLVHHQHFFPVVAEKGELKEAFLAVVNTQPSDERLIAKNAERVVAARLRDAKFFWDADRKTKLENRLDRLHTIVFHKKLGSYRDKTERIEKLARTIAADVLGAAEHADQAALAARLAKADLVTDMVFEFPELQGVMGGVYAREEALPEQVWKAIYYHYLPHGVEADAAPSTRELGAAATTWAALSLADKLDSFAALSKAGERATGSRDPFGLRRQMQGIIKILMDLPELTGIDREVSIAHLAPLAAADVPTSVDPWDAAAVISGNAHERIRFALQQRGFNAATLRAAVSTSGSDNPLRARRLAEALKSLEGSADLAALAVLFKRVKNIAKELTSDVAFDRAVLTEPAELALLADLDARRPRINGAAQASDYRRAFTEIAGLRQAVDRFFTEVFVMADDPRLRTARLKLMADLRDMVLDLADISELAADEGKQA
jgi:glycyl-tRNA synthetase beta chain